MTSKVVLFDIDRTLFDADGYKDFIYHILSTYTHLPSSKSIEKMQQIYHGLRSPFGSFDPIQFIKKVSEEIPFTVTEDSLFDLIVNPAVLTTFLYPEVRDVLIRLKENPRIKLGIFSNGDTSMQLAKVGSLIDLFHPDLLFVYLYKKDKITGILHTIPHELVYLVDDIEEILTDSKYENPQLITVWSNRKSIVSYEHLNPDFVIAHLEELFEIVSVE